ncbi:MAG: hypothetical protein PF486_05820 [Prolixibacteraceae bacterium]|jgi:hypothetical protein|nr:hypothetical protein [Prolixibacteraceae bacterium]
MEVTRKNYEEWFIDWLDGNLSAGQEEKLRAFLRDNPDLQAELEGIETIKIEPENYEFDSSHLKKSVFDQHDVFEEACIRSIENDHAENDEKEFQEYIAQNPKAAEEYKLFKASKLVPDKTLVHGDVEKLKRKRKLPVYRLAAAAVVFIAALFWFNRPDEQAVSIPYFEVVALNEKPETELSRQAIVRHEPLKALQLPSRNVEQVKPIIAEQREILMIEPLASKTSLASTSNPELNPPGLQDISLPYSEDEHYPTVRELLAEKVNSISPEEEKNKLAKFALNQVKNATNDRFDYSTTGNGKVEKIEFNSRILAFSIPIE